MAAAFSSSPVKAHDSTRSVVALTISSAASINDADILQKLANLIRAQNLKPTTALKLLGIDEVSHQRRIRDKYRAGKAA